MSDAKLAQKLTVKKTIALGELCKAYLEQIPEGALEESTLQSIGIHSQHFNRILGEKTTLRSIRFAELQQYVSARSKEPDKRDKISAETIRKELATFGALWNWAYGLEYVSVPFFRKGLVLPKLQDKPPSKHGNKL